MNTNFDVALEYGMPAAVETEKLVLGAALGQSATNMLATLEVDDFFLEKHRQIYAAIAALETVGGGIDRVTVATELKRRGQLESVSGIGYLVSLDEGLPTLVNLDRYIEIVKDKAILRRAILAHQQAINECLIAADPTAEILERAQSAISLLAAKGARTLTFRSPREVLERAGGLSAIVNPDKSSCVPTPWGGLNQMLAGGGFLPGQMIIIGARPSMGKTALACQIADFAAKNGTPTAFFTLEMSESSILLRMAAARARVNTLKVTQRRATDGEMNAMRRAFSELLEEGDGRLWIDDTTGCTVPAMRAALRRLCGRQSIGLVLVDYLQLVEVSGGGGPKPLRAGK